MDEFDELDPNGEDLINSPLVPIENKEFESSVDEDDDFSMFDDSSQIERARFEGQINVGSTEFGQSQFDEGAVFDQLDDLNSRRANLQPWTDQFANAFTQVVAGEIVGGTIKGIGYLLDVGSMYDYITGTETEWGNAITRLGEAIHEGTEENTRIYEKTPGEMNLFDSGYWFKNSVSIGSTIAMMIPSMAATRMLGMLGKVVSRSNSILKLTKKANWIKEGVTQAVVSRHIENSLESKGTFDATYQDFISSTNPETGENYTDEEAKMHAAKAASENYRKGWLMIGQDILQYMAIGRVFNPVAMKFETGLGKKALSKIIPKRLAGTVKVAGVFGSEAAEESYQYYISQQAQNRSKLNAGLITQKEYDKVMKEILGDDEMKTSALFGGLGGAVFQSVGPRMNKLFKGKTALDRQKVAEEVYRDHLINRAKDFASLQNKLDSADEKISKVERDRIIHGAMSTMVIDALERDQFDLFIETLDSVSKMTQEEKAELDETSGTEFSTELFNSHLPDVKKLANEIKEDYMRHRNKYDAPIAARMAHIDHYARKMEESRDAIKQDSSKLVSDIKGESSIYNSELNDLNIRLKAIKSVRARNKVEIPRLVDRRRSIVLEIITEEQEKEIKDIENKISELKKSDQKLSEKDKKYNVAFEGIVEDLTNLKIQDIFIENAMTMDQIEQRDLRSKEYQDDFKIRRDLDIIDSKNDPIELKKDISNIEFMEDATEEYKTVIKTKLESRLKQVEKDIANKKAEEEDEATKAELIRKKKENQDDPTIVDNDDPNSFNGNNLEGLQGNSVNTDDQQNDKHDESVKIKSTANTALLDKVDGTERYQEWLTNGETKVGTKVTIKLSESNKGLFGKVADEFFAFFPGKSKVTEDTYNYLPIMVEVSEGVFTFLPTKTKGNKFFDANYYAERKAIIDRLWKGETVTSTIKASSGGELMVDMDYENNMVPENSLLELSPVKGKVENIEFRVSDKDGRIMDTSKQKDNDFETFQMVVKGEKDKDGAVMPYRGELFIKVPRADGTPFLLKVNFNRTNEAEATILAELMVDIAVPLEDKGAKLIENSTKLSELSKELQAKIRETMPEVSKMFGGNPSVLEIIDSYVYVSDRTEGLSSQLFYSGIHLNFSDGLSVRPDNREIAKGELITFLMEKKRRQFNIKSWNETEGYKDFILGKNGALSTNSKVGEPLFQTKGDRRAQVWMAPVRPEKVTPKPKPKEVKKEINVVTKVDQDSRRAKTDKIGYVYNDDYEHKIFFYYKPGGGTLSVEAETMSEGKKKIKALYDAEVLEVSDTKISKKKKTVVPSAPVSKSTGLRGKRKKSASKTTAKKKNLMGTPKSPKDLIDSKKTDKDCK